MKRSRCGAAAWVAVLALAATACGDREAAKQRYLESGNKLMAQHKVPEAIVEYRNALRSDPRFGEAHRQLAEAYVQAQNPQAAFREFVRAADLLPDNLDVQLKTGHFLLIAQQYADAKARAEAVLKRDPRNIEALIMKANAMAGLKDIAGAVEDLEQAISGQDADPRLYTSLGSLRQLEGQRPEAEDAYRKAIEVGPKSADARVALATFYLATGRTQDAERVVNEALTIDPAHQQGNRLLALIYLGTRRANEAERPLKAMVREYDGQSRLALADYYIGMRRMDDAVPILKDLLNRPLTRSDATLRLASIDYSAGRKVDASKSVDALLVKEPRNVRALALKARWQLAAGNINGAVETARAATKADASWADAHYVLGVALVAKRDNPEAATSLKEAIRLNPRFVAAQVLLSRVQLASGDVVAAVQSAQDAKKQAPTNLDAQLVLVRGLLTKGDLVAAEPEVRALLAKYPKNASAHTMNGFLLLGKKDEAGARAAFRRAVDLNPALPEPLEGLLTLDARAHKLPDAVHRIEGTLAATPDNPNLLIVAARTYGAAGQVDKKEKALRRVIELDPDNMPAYLLLGQTYVATKKLDEAVAQYDAVAKRHENIGASTMAAILVDMQHRREDAIKRYEAIVATHQRAPVAANNLAWIYAERGDNLEMALQLAQDAKSQLPNTPAVSDTLGWIYYKKGLPQLAIEPLEDSVAKDPNNATYRYHLGLAYAKAGQKEKARVALERALQLSPQFDGASTARETLESLKS